VLGAVEFFTSSFIFYGRRLWSWLLTRLPSGGLLLP
jgi:hypothetical protein